MLQSDYDYPLGRGFFKNIKTIPSYNVYIRDFYGDFLRYLYFMCIQNSDGEYPLSIPIEEIINELNNPIHQGEKPIKKILIGEAPPAQIPGSNTVNYFYNPKGKWPILSPWISALIKAMFNGRKFATKIDFLIACSREGFLLLDLFPYAISYNRRVQPYIDACVSAFGISQANNPAYPYNIMNTLNWLSPCINRNLAIGFGLKLLGEAVLNNQNCINDFDAWAIRNNILLFSNGSIAKPRPVPASINGASKYLRVCGLRGPGGPHAGLLTLAGF